jgi:hypothetical protein
MRKQKYPIAATQSLDRLWLASTSGKKSKNINGLDITLKVMKEK